MIVTCHAASDRCRGLLAGYYRKVGLGVTQGEVQVRRVQGRDGRRGRPGRGLSLERIVSTTLELVDEEGIGAATMREVASRLGVRSMSLYRYVRDRDELLDAVVERIVGDHEPADRGRQGGGCRPGDVGDFRGHRDSGQLRLLFHLRGLQLSEGTG